MRGYKKLMPLFMVSVIAIGIILTVSQRANAVSNPYPNSQDVDGDGYYEVPCTRFAWQQAYDNVGVALPAWGNAVNWWQNAKNAGYSTGSTPQANSIAVWSGDYYGHVAYVTSGNGNTFTVNEGGRTDTDNTDSHGVVYGYTLTNAVGSSRPYDSNKILLGFIYLKDTPTTSVSWAESDKEEITENKIFVYKTVSLSGATMNDMSSVGINVYDANGNKIGSKSEVPDRSGGSYVNIFYDFKDELGINIQRGAVYEYQLYVVVKGKTYNSNRYKIIVPGGVSPTATPTAVPKATATPIPKAPTKAPIRKPTIAPTKKPIVRLSLDKTSAAVVCGKTEQLVATLTGSTDKISWKSSDSNVAIVDNNGNVTGKMAGQVTVSASAAGKTAKCKIQVLYKDVTNASKFWYEPTNNLTNSGIVKGYNKQTSFKPSNECTRAQMVTFIWRLEGCPEPESTKSKFKDIKKSDYFYKACIWGNEQGVVEGYKDGTFGPQIVCARRHAVTFLWRLAGKPDPKSSINKFKDVKKKDYFYLATLWASEKNILEGYADGTFRPDGECLRRQMVTFLYKYDKFVNGNS